MKYIVERLDGNVIIDYEAFDTLESAHDWCEDWCEELNSEDGELGEVARIYKCVEKLETDVDEDNFLQMEWKKEE